MFSRRIKKEYDEMKKKSSKHISKCQWVNFLTSLGDNGASSNDDDGPVELGLEVRDDLVADLAESSE